MASRPADARAARPLTVDRIPGELERRIVSVLFCDLAGFTSLSERLDAEDVATVQGAYFEAVRDAVTRHGGTLEKFIGDAAVAVYGVPVAREDDAERAVRTGLAIVGAVEQLSARLALAEGALDVRVGVQSGEAVVHPSPLPGEAMVTGDVVNTAARLQAAAPLGSVLLGGPTALAVASSVELEGIGGLVLKGKAEPVAAYRALAALPEPERERAMGGLSARTVGRDRELDLLLRALEDCTRGVARRVTVVAPPGTGKSRLLRELERSAIDAGADVRVARVRPDALAAFRPVADLVGMALADDGLAIGNGDGIRATLERRLGPERAEVVAGELVALVRGSGEAAAAGEPDALRAARFAAWSDGLGALGSGPEVWLVEDVHWATPDFRAFVGAATTDVARGRLVVSTARPSLLEEDAGWVSRGDRIALEPLSAETTGELVHALVGDALSDDVVRAIAEGSAGNPLFVEELLRSWVSTGLLERHGQVWALRATVAEIELPSTVQGIYAAQLDDLPAAARLVVRRASVAGRQFPIGALDSLDASSPGGLEVLVRRGIAHGPVADRVLGESYLFRHALLRDVGYASLSRAERARLHVRMARWLESLGEERAGQVAEVTGRHYAAALQAAPALSTEVGDGLGRPDAALLAAGWFERAGREALATSANDAARGLFERALELTAPDDDLARARRLLGLARSIAFTSDMNAGLEAATTALSILRSLVGASGVGDRKEAREEASRAASVVGTILTQQLRFADAVGLAGEVLAELGGLDDAATVRLLLVRIRGAGMIGDEAWDGTAADRARALGLSRELGDTELELEARMCTVWDEPDVRSAWADIERLASELRRWPDVAEARRARAALCLPDDLDGVLEGSARLLSFADAHQLHELRAWSRYYVAEARFAGGDWSAALASGVAALDLAEAGSYHRAAARTWFAILPPAAARSDRVLLERAAGWYARLDSFPDSPYGRISRTASDILLETHGHPSTFRVELALLGPSIVEGASLPSWYEALDVVVAHALAAGEVVEAQRALEWFAQALARAPSAAGAAARTLLEARVLFADSQDLLAVRGRAGVLRAHASPWPLLKCLHLLVEGEAADEGEIAEARTLEKQLGIGVRESGAPGR